jgi:hypothetical protein
MTTKGHPPQPKDYFVGLNEEEGQANLELRLDAQRTDNPVFRPDAWRGISRRVKACYRDQKLNSDNNKSGSDRMAVFLRRRVPFLVVRAFYHAHEETIR